MSTLHGSAGGSIENLDNQPGHSEHTHIHLAEDEKDEVQRTSSSQSDPERDLEDGPETGDQQLEEELARERKEHELDPNLIVFDGPDDPDNPQNWPRQKKWQITVIMGLMTLCITFASSVFSTATRVTATQFHVSTEVMTLGTSLFVLGFAVGPIIWGPGSELWGRRKPLFTGFFLFIIFQIPVAVAVNLQTIMLCRFFGGVFGAAPLAVVAGALADIWDPVDRGVAVCLFASATFIGPVLGPISKYPFLLNKLLGHMLMEV